MKLKRRHAKVETDDLDFLYEHTPLVERNGNELTIGFTDDQYLSATHWGEDVEIDEFGVMTGGWPTAEELATARVTEIKDGRPFSEDLYYEGVEWLETVRTDSIPTEGRTDWTGWQS